MRITKSALDERIAELEVERVRLVTRTDATYDGAIQELKRLRDSLEDNHSDNKRNKEK